MGRRRDVPGADHDAPARARELQARYRRLAGPQAIDPPELAEEVEASIARERDRLTAEGAPLAELVEGLERFIQRRIGADGWEPERKAAAERDLGGDWFASLHGGNRQRGSRWVSG